MDENAVWAALNNLSVGTKAKHLAQLESAFKLENVQRYAVALDLLDNGLVRLVEVLDAAHAVGVKPSECKAQLYRVSKFNEQAAQILEDPKE